MEKKNFSDIGKIEAIKLLFEESPFKQADGTSYLCGEKGGVIRTASKLWLEGIDFDLIGGIVCLLLALCVLVSYFNVDALLLKSTISSVLT